MSDEMSDKEPPYGWDDISIFVLGDEENNELPKLITPKQIDELFADNSTESTGEPLDD